MSMSQKQDFTAVRNATYSKIYYVSDENLRLCHKHILFARHARAYPSNKHTLKFFFKYKAVLSGILEPPEPPMRGTIMV